jgi:hypothetical protein
MTDERTVDELTATFETVDELTAAYATVDELRDGES